MIPCPEQRNRQNPLKDKTSDTLLHTNVFFRIFAPRYSLDYYAETVFFPIRPLHQALSQVCHLGRNSEFPITVAQRILFYGYHTYTEYSVSDR